MGHLFGDEKDTSIQPWKIVKFGIIDSAKQACTLAYNPYKDPLTPL